MDSHQAIYPLEFWYERPAEQEEDFFAGERWSTTRNRGFPVQDVRVHAIPAEKTFYNLYYIFSTLDLPIQH
jgi:hypothetical protein